MKFLVFSVWTLFLLSFSISAKTIVISDIDDTIKMTGVLNNKVSVAINGIFGTKAFAGMSELYNEYERNGADIYYVSGSPQVIDSRIEKFLIKRDFPHPEQRYLKDKISSDTYKFKVEAIRKILADNPESTVVLVGDDTEHDPVVYHDISQEYPGRVEAIYIRAIQNAKLPINLLIKNFFSSVEIATYEMLRNQIDYAGLENVVAGFINQKNKSGIQLKGFYCPKNGRDEIRELVSKAQTSGMVQMSELLVLTQNKIMGECNRR